METSSRYLRLNIHHRRDLTSELGRETTGVKRCAVDDLGVDDLVEAAENAERDRNSVDVICILSMLPANVYFPCRRANGPCEILLYDGGHSGGWRRVIRLTLQHLSAGPDIDRVYHPLAWPVCVDDHFLCRDFA